MCIVMPSEGTLLPSKFLLGEANGGGKSKGTGAAATHPLVPLAPLVTRRKCLASLVLILFGYTCLHITS